MSKPKPDKPRLRLTDRQVRIFLTSMKEFGYQVSFDSGRDIADEVANGTYDHADPVARILCKQIDEAAEAIRKGERPQ